MAKGMHKLGILTGILVVSVLVVSGAAWVMATFAESDPTVSAPEKVSPDEEFTVTGITDDPPVSIQVRNKKDREELPGSPDDGSDTPGGINTLDTKALGLESGDIIEVIVTNHSGQSKTVTIEVD